MIRTLAMLALVSLACGSQSAAAACSVSATSIVFVNYTATSLVNVTGTIEVDCSRGTDYHVALNAGLSSGGSITARSMTGPASMRLGYGLYSDSAHTENWGDTKGTGYVSGTGTGRTQTLTVYAQIPANEFVEPGSYTDTITVKVTGSSTATTTFSVRSTVLSACTISATGLAFGAYTGKVVNSTSGISVTCTKTTAYSVGLSAGLASGATVTNRSMIGPSLTLLHYSLFTNSGLTVNWGNTVGANAVAGTGNGALQSLSVYGQIPGGQFVRPGAYADTITATITY